MSKVCNTCKELKPFEQYHINKNGRNGRHNVCKKCRSISTNKLNYERKTDGKKLCPKCNIVKVYIEFSRDRHSSDGCQTYCKDCQHQIMKKHCGQFNKYMKKIYNDMVRKAKNRDIDVIITVDYIEQLWNKQSGICALTGEKMTHTVYSSREQKRRNLYNASIDRIDFKRGYTEDNVQLILSAINTIKWDIGIDHFLLMCKKVSDFHF